MSTSSAIITNSSENSYHESFLQHLHDNPLAMMLRSQEGDTSLQPMEQQPPFACSNHRPTFHSSDQFSTADRSRLGSNAPQTHTHGVSPHSPAMYRPFYSCSKLRRLKKSRSTRASLRFRRNVSLSPIEIPSRKPAKKDRKKPGAVDWAKIRAKVQAIRNKKKAATSSD